MQLNLERPADFNLIRNVKQDSGGCQIQVGENTYNESVIITPQGIELWAAESVSALKETHFAALASLSVELVILGTGPAIHFPDQAIYRSLIDQHIGIEIMDTAAACRTYNILAGDERPVAAALILW